MRESKIINSKPGFGGELFKELCGLSNSVKLCKVSMEIYKDDAKYDFP